MPIGNTYWNTWEYTISRIHCSSSHSRTRVKRFHKARGTSSCWSWRPRRFHRSWLVLKTTSKKGWFTWETKFGIETSGGSRTQQRNTLAMAEKQAIKFQTTQTKTHWTKQRNKQSNRKLKLWMPHATCPPRCESLWVPGVRYAKRSEH